jgi:imidazolonepropionase-like amidohydrolase
VESIRDAVNAGFDCLEHVDFMWPDGKCSYDPEVGELVAESGCWVSPTPQVAHTFIRLLERKEELARLSPRDLERKGRLEQKLHAKLHVIGQLRDLGVPMTLGSDELVHFGCAASGLELLVDAGMSPLEALMCATVNGALALGVGDTVGSVQVGKVADLVVAQGNVCEDISRLQRVSQVFKRGVPVPAQAAAVFAD